METLTIDNNETVSTQATETAKKGKSKKTKPVVEATEAIATTPATEVIEQAEVTEQPTIKETKVVAGKPKSQPRQRNQGIRLTDREKEVLKDLANGLSNDEVAQRLALSRRTIEAHRARIMLKLNVHTMAGLTKYAIKHNLVNLD